MPKLRERLRDAAILIGIASTSYGASLVYRPAGFIGFGLFAVGFGIYDLWVAD